VRSSEAACPFCSASLPKKLAAKAVPAAGRRLERLAAFTFAATLAVTGCVVGGAEEETGQSEDDLGGIMPMYGMPPPWKKDAGKADSGKDAGKDAAKDSGKDAAKDAGAPCDDGGVYAMYGAPGWMPPPCPPEEDEKDGGGVMPMYGMPPMDPE
jgi:hypothetical protein